MANRDTASLAGRIMPRMMVYSVSQPDLYAEYFERVIMPRRRWLHEFCGRASDAASCAPDLDVEMAAIALVGPIVAAVHSAGPGTRTSDRTWPGGSIGRAVAGPGRPRPGAVAGRRATQLVSSRIPAASERSWSIGRPVRGRRWGAPEVNPGAAGAGPGRAPDNAGDSPRHRGSSTGRHRGPRHRAATHRPCDLRQSGRGRLIAATPARP